MTTTITRLFDDYADAQAAVASLEQAGIPHADLSIVANDAGRRHEDHGVGVRDLNDHGDVSRGASTGALLGGAGGLLAGLGLLAIPGLGPIVAAGWLVATAAGAGIGAAGGAATGSIVGALKNAGHSDEEAHVYSEGVRRGGTLLSARVPEDRAAEVEALIERSGGVNAATRGRVYRESGWSSFDENAAPYSVEQIAAERDRYAARAPTTL